MPARPALRPSPSNAFSFSRVSSFSQCPLRYRYRYVDGLSEAFTSVEAYLGTTIHQVLEWLYQRRDEDASPSAAAAAADFESRWDEGFNEQVAVVRRGEAAATYRAQGRVMVERFVREVFARDRSVTVALERRVGRELPGGLRFTGFADRVGRTERGRLFVVDYKTSRSAGNAESEALQAPLYAACVVEEDGCGEALAGYHYLRHGTTSWHTVRADGCPVLWQRFGALALEAATAREYPARPGVLCAWCGFNRTCPSAAVPPELSGGQTP